MPREGLMSQKNIKTISNPKLKLEVLTKEDVQKRIKDLQVGNARLLTTLFILDGDVMVERKFHELNENVSE
mgnify:CR=1 FL=1